MKRLLIVFHTQSGNTGKLADAVLRGARGVDEPELEIVLREAVDATLEDFLGCQGLIIGTPENFGYMAGMIKDFLDRVFYSAEGKVDALPYAVFVSAGNDGTQAPFQIERILTGLRMKRVHDPVIVVGEPDAAGCARCEELGATVAAGLAFGVF